MCCGWSSWKLKVVGLDAWFKVDDFFISSWRVLRIE
jgi:hypothetical protein